MKQEDLINKWLNNALSTEEKQELKRSEDFGLFEEIVKEAHRFKVELPSNEVLFQSVQTKIEKPEKTISFKRWISIGISVAAICVLGFFIFQNTSNQPITIVTELAENKEVSLPDNSLVKMNGLSKVVYSPSDWADNRTVLLKGEAFFDVEKGSKFDVQTAQGTISVLGTEFNIKVNEDAFEVVCYEGRVQVKGKNFEQILNAGQQLKLGDSKPDVSLMYLLKPSWVHQMSIYKNAPLESVFSGLEKQFSIKIDDTVKNKNIMFSGAFKHNNLKDALKAVTTPLNLEFEIKSDELVIIKDTP